MNLGERTCVPCRGDEEPLRGAALRSFVESLSGGWEAVEEHHLVRHFSFPDFAAALEFTNRVGAIAEREGHHPDLLLGWGRVEVRIWTHAIDGLSENDFILAAKIDRLSAG